MSVFQAAVLAAAAVREQLADALLGIEAAREAAGGAEHGGGDSALVIDGRALAHALGPDMRQTLLAVRAAWPSRNWTALHSDVPSPSFQGYSMRQQVA